MLVMLGIYTYIYTQLDHCALKLESLLWSYKLPGNYKIPAHIFKVGDEMLCSEIHKCINSIRNKEELADQ
jgi:hypothetical protein